MVCSGQFCVSGYLKFKYSYNFHLVILSNSVFKNKHTNYHHKQYFCFCLSSEYIKVENHWSRSLGMEGTELVGTQSTHYLLLLSGENGLGGTLINSFGYISRPFLIIWSEGILKKTP